MYDAVQPRLVTEFTYRHSPHKDKALIYMALEQPEGKVRLRLRLRVRSSPTRLGLGFGLGLGLGRHLPG